MNLKEWLEVKEWKFYHYREDLENILSDVFGADISLLDSDEEFSAHCNHEWLNKEMFVKSLGIVDILGKDKSGDLESYLNMASNTTDYDQILDIGQKSLDLFEGATGDKEVLHDIKMFIVCWLLVSLNQEMTFYALTYEYPAILEVQ